MTTLTFSAVDVELNGSAVLHAIDVSLDVRRIAVIGENGSGKSTFARLINGLVTATRGEVSIDGIDPARDPAGVRSTVGFVFSDPRAQLVMPTVLEDVAFSLRGRGLSKTAIRESALQALAAVGIAHLAESSVHAISGGQQQLLALAGSLVRRPTVMVADEPTATLDARNARRIADRLLGLDAQLVCVTHDMSLAARCDLALRFSGGTLVAVGTPSDVIAEYERSLADEGAEA